jgi:hypothetical protein
MTDFDQMLAAHVAFELECWGPDRAEESAAAEIRAFWAWLEQVPVSDIADADTIAGWIDELVLTRSVGPQLAEQINEAVISVHRTAADDGTTVAELLPEAEFEQAARAAAGMDDIQRAIITQVTSSEVYAKLISHVLYEGLKGYLTEENPVSKRVPGAASMLKLGQNAIGTAAPGLSQGIDRQLTAFVNSNISDAMRDSQEYLIEALSEERLLETATEVYQEAAGTTVAEAAAEISEESVSSMVTAGLAVWEHLRTTGTVYEMVRAPIAAFLDGWGDQPIGKLLVAAGITSEDIVTTFSPTAAEWIERAYADGYLEERIRARLEPFYQHMAQQQ